MLAVLELLGLMLVAANDLKVDPCVVQSTCDTVQQSWSRSWET